MMLVDLVQLEEEMSTDRVFFVPLISVHVVNEIRVLT